MYALSRPYAVDSATSSPLAARISSGNDTHARWRSMVRRTSSRTSGSDSSGTAYSISEKRTRRGETKTLWASSTYRRVDTVFAGKAVGEGKGVVGGKRGVMSGEGRTSKKETMNNNRWK